MAKLVFNSFTSAPNRSPGAYVGSRNSAASRAANVASDRADRATERLDDDDMDDEDEEEVDNCRSSAAALHLRAASSHDAAAEFHGGRGSARLQSQHVLAADDHRSKAASIASMITNCACQEPPLLPPSTLDAVRRDTLARNATIDRFVKEQRDASAGSGPRGCCGTGPNTSQADGNTPPNNPGRQYGSTGYEQGEADGSDDSDSEAENTNQDTYESPLVPPTLIGSASPLFAGPGQRFPTPAELMAMDAEQERKLNGTPELEMQRLDFSRGGRIVRG